MNKFTLTKRSLYNAFFLSETHIHCSIATSKASIRENPKVDKMFKLFVIFGILLITTCLVALDIITEVQGLEIIICLGKLSERFIKVRYSLYL